MQQEQLCNRHRMDIADLACKKNFAAETEHHLFCDFFQQAFAKETIFLSIRVGPASVFVGIRVSF